VTADRTELRLVVVGLAVAAGLVVVQVAIGAQHRLFGDDATTRESVITCLTQQKGLEVREVRDPIAATASGGYVSTVVEGNPVTLSITGSFEEARRLVRLYSGIGADLKPPQLQRREHFVSLWSAQPTSVQLQAVYDCTA
jgi:hypothetical protein